MQEKKNVVMTEQNSTDESTSCVNQSAVTEKIMCSQETEAAAEKHTSAGESTEGLTEATEKQTEDREAYKDSQEALEDRESREESADGAETAEGTRENTENTETEESARDVTESTESREVNKAVESKHNVSEAGEQTEESTEDNTEEETDRVEKPKGGYKQIGHYISSLPKEKQKEIRSKGGKAVQAKYKARRTLGEELVAILEHGDNQEKLCLALFQAGLSGDYRAFNSLRDTIGEMPTQKQEVSTAMTDADRELMDNVLARLNEGKKG